ncbi:MAG: GAF domain-containing protein, partial [Candidatus Omnitrophica bacterium]|nr:GAF domain-containing protein [Candidatus Omnitrophota bacterium]
MTDSQLQTTETKAEIKSRLERLETLYDLSLDIFAAKNLDDLLRVVMSRVTSALGADRSTLFIVNQDAEILWSKVAQGTEPIILPMGVGLAGMVAASGETLNIPDAYLDDRFNSEIDKKTGYHTKTILCMPVKDREGNVVAVIQAINKIGGAFSEDDEDFLRALSAQIQLAIENSTLYQGLKELFESMIEALASTIDARHPTTAGHTNRVRNYSLEIAKEMGYSPADLEILNYAA